MAVDPVPGKLKFIGQPYQGTHGKAFNVAGGSDNWESENAVDLAVPTGTPVYAVEDGTIGSQIGSLGQGGRFAGLRLHLQTGNNEFYYAHLSKIVVKAGQTVKAGQVIGYSGSANGVQHLHFASKTGSPNDVLGTMPSSGPSPTGGDGSPAAGPSAPTAASAQADADREAQLQQNLQQNIQPLDLTPTVGVPLASAPGGDTPGYDTRNPQGVASTWQLIAAQGQVSPETQMMASLAQYANG